MPTYTLRGVDIEFPYEAYDCQVRQGRCPNCAASSLPCIFSFPLAFFDLLPNSLFLPLSLALSFSRSLSLSLPTMKPNEQVAYMEQVVKALQDVRFCFCSRNRRQ